MGLVKASHAQSGYFPDDAIRSAFDPCQNGYFEGKDIMATSATHPSAGSSPTVWLGKRAGRRVMTNRRLS
jgi:hypothetical protein